MDKGRYRLSPAVWVVLMVALGSAACEAESSPPGDAPATTAESESSADADALRAAEGTVRAFFSVKRHAQDDPSVQIDAQEAYLTARGVHPGAASEAGWAATRPASPTRTRASSCPTRGGSATTSRSTSTSRVRT